MKAKLAYHEAATSLPTTIDRPPRARIEALIETLLAILNELDGHADAEPVESRLAAPALALACRLCGDGSQENHWADSGTDDCEPNGDEETSRRNDQQRESAPAGTGRSGFFTCYSLLVDPIQ
jgi:hypothetical protein